MAFHYSDFMTKLNTEKNNLRFQFFINEMSLGLLIRWIRTYFVSQSVLFLILCLIYYEINNKQ